MRRASDGCRRAIQPKVKKVAVNARLGQDLKQPLGIVLDPLRQAVPILAIDRRRERLDLKIIFDVDRHRAEHAPALVRRGVGDRNRQRLRALRTQLRSGAAATWPPGSLPLTLKIMGGDFDRAPEQAIVLVDVLFERGEAFDKGRKSSA